MEKLRPSALTGGGVPKDGRPRGEAQERREASTDEFVPPTMLVPRHKGGKSLADLVSEGRGGTVESASTGQGPESRQPIEVDDPAARFNVKPVAYTVPYTIAADDLELLVLAIERYRKVTTIAEFKKTRRYASGVNIRLLRARPDLDLELSRVYLAACHRLGLDPDDPDGRDGGRVPDRREGS